MRAVTWLHISDFHLRESEEWPQKAVISAMLENIEERCAAGLEVDFVLATGDLAFAGEDSEYDLVAGFLDQLSTTIGLPCQLIYCVPGNHDVQRERYKTLFDGARQKLGSENEVYAFLSDTDERKALLSRQAEFSRFQERVFAMQERTRTADDLGYVSLLNIEDLRIAIIGLNSAWLSKGGDSDERQLVLGEYQVISAIDIAASTTPHVIIGMQHHPFDYLKRFDQQATQRRVEDACHFFHCGHLHQPDATQAVTRSGKCLRLAAGASYESRIFHNAYSVVTLDPLHARTDVTFVQYTPWEGAFSFESNRSYLHELVSATSCTTIELATGIERYCQDAVDISYYLASLLLGDVTDVPIRTKDSVVFGAPALLSRNSDRELMEATLGILAVGRAVRLLYGHKELDEILTDHGEPIRKYVEKLRVLGASYTGLGEQIVMRNNDAADLAGADDMTPFRHTLSLLDELLAQGDWEGLRELSERCRELNNPTVAAKGKRALALCLARYSDSSDRLRAICLYRELVLTEYCEAGDWAGLATLLTDEGKHEEAKNAVKDGMKAFPEKIVGFVEVGKRIVTATGDIQFRNELWKHQKEERFK